jgi:hypothetical protein
MHYTWMLCNLPTLLLTIQSVNFAASLTIVSRVSAQLYHWLSWRIHCRTGWFAANPLNSSLKSISDILIVLSYHSPFNETTPDTVLATILMLLMVMDLLQKNGRCIKTYCLY